MRLLFVASHVPDASGKGYQVRLHHQIVELAQRHEVSLVAFVPPGAVVKREVRNVCRDIRLVPWSQGRALRAAMFNVARYPASVALFRESRFTQALRESMRAYPIDLAHIQLIRMAPYMSEAREYPTVLDLLDSSGLNMAARARLSPPGGRLLLDFEARRIHQFEVATAQHASLVLLISKRDQDELGHPANSRVNTNGVTNIESETSSGGRDPRSLIFTGTMSYPPNADAASWFALAILPLVRERFPDVSFRVVGRRPGPHVRGLAGHESVTVTGEVPSVHKELRRAAIAVCPVRQASGVQTKILEAMAAGTPVVATPLSVRGLPDNLQPYAFVAEQPAEFAETVTSLLADPDKGLLRAREALSALQNHTWRGSVDQLEEYYREAISLGRSRG